MSYNESLPPLLFPISGRTHVCQTGDERHKEYLIEKETEEYKERVIERAKKKKNDSGRYNGKRL